MEQYASIGKKALKNAIGLQSNRKETTYEPVQKLDEKASGCLSCKYYSLKKAYENAPDSEAYRSACQACANCPNRQYTTVFEEKITYINETNKYGYNSVYSATLKGLGIKMFLVLHMLHPDRYGVILNVRLEDLREQLSCDRKTIVSNLDYLKKYGYIDYIKTARRGYVNIIINDYDSYFKPAREGGRGYMTFSKELVESLIQIKDLTTLRLFLHQLIDTDNHTDTEKSIFTKTFQELKNCLPGYYKPNHIRKGLQNNQNNPIFTLIIGDNVSFSLNDNFNAKKMKEQVIQDSKKYYVDYIDRLNDSFEQINTGKALPAEVLSEGFCKERLKKYPSYSVNLSILTDLAKMTWQYSIHDITDAIDYIYINYVTCNKPVDNYPGLVRTLIPQIREMRQDHSFVA